jgi:hypothetical protein
MLLKVIISVPFLRDLPVDEDQQRQKEAQQKQRAISNDEDF